VTILYYLLLVLHIVACFFLIGVVLLQQGKNQDLASAFGGGGTQTAFGPRGSANVLSRATTILAGLFMVTSLSLTVLRPRESSVLDQLPASTAPASSSAPAASQPAAPASSTAPAEAAPAASSAPATSAPAPAASPTTN
jgi:preprotein translocase subunit SecG